MHTYTSPIEDPRNRIPRGPVARVFNGSNPQEHVTKINLI